MKNSIKTLGILAVLFFLMMGLLVAPAAGAIVGSDKQSGPHLSSPSVKIRVDITGDTKISQQYQGDGSAVIHVHADQNETKVTLTTKDGTQVTTAQKQGK